ncbi:hypothetical protein L6452_09260 [Arctium lappa]|uniref:Uncharacterized protein n=1 Tax=Arctium lappa TaxID=4217 RepID=A0ACB9DJJ2_ARCLA|nr:hypothetical protein L6452_09260 [Arctium lappa]
MDFKSTNKEEKLCLVSSKIKEAWLWHNRFCHLNFHTLEKLVKLELVSGLPSIKFDRGHLCSACEMGKLKRVAHKSMSDISCTKPLQMLHVDLCGSISVQILGGCRGFEVTMVMSLRKPLRPILQHRAFHRTSQLRGLHNKMVLLNGRTKH